MDNLKQLYANLIMNVAQNHNKYGEKGLTVFTALKGINYQSSQNKVMIVGRAPNKWEHDFIPRKEDSIEKCISSVHNTIEEWTLNWVKNLWGKTLNEEGKKKYNTKKSAFWRLSKNIAKHQNPNTEFSIDSIVWSNLYKISNQKGGNPSAKLKDVQFHLCKQILDAEIDYYKPKYIVFLTGSNWALPFLKDATQVQNCTSKYVKQVGIYCGSIYVIAQHPQGKSEEAHLKEIVQYLK